MATTSQQVTHPDENFRYGQLAIEGRLITPEQFDAAMDRAKESGRPLREVLVESGMLDATTAERLDKALKRILRDERTGSASGVHHKKQIGGYRLIRRIGEGGMGEVYLAEQLSMHRTVALKILHQKWADDEEFRKRFLLEARAAGKLSHPNIIQVFDVGKYQGLYYFSMEYVDGVTVEDMINHDGPLPVDRVIDIARQVCDALAYLSQHGIVHRDIKPANIMVMRDGTVKLGDFGFIQQSLLDRTLMKEGTTIGTPDYISPEQARGERDLDVRSDIYSLGASLFHMLTARTMYSGTCSAVMRAHIDTPPPRLHGLRRDLPERLVEIVERMLAKSVADRYQSAEDIIKDLELLKLELAGKRGELPTSKSGILTVIQAERERIASLERQLHGLRVAVWIWMILALCGFVLAAVFVFLWAAR
ncbi:MAG: protein kinase [Planctomycetota bacterium]|nr:protein kinase [Planctomycetota bacterium]MCX8040346.1 protein kinase [Planctomycetota bacterium]MDW8373802.1 protein kinase [Planctomycetota bacterium]